MISLPVLTVHIILLGIMLLGLFSLLLVVVPGLVIIWAAILISILAYSIPHEFTLLTILLILLETIVMIIGNLIDNVIIGAKARENGAGWISLGVALVCGIIGSLLFPPLGGLIAAPLGLMIAETIRLHDYRLAFSTTRGMVSGCGWSVITRLAIGVLMIFGWLLWFYFTVFNSTNPIEALTI